MYKKVSLILTIAILLILTGTLSADNDRIVVPLTNPGKACNIKISVMKGDITVTGYKGSEIIVETRLLEKRSSKRAHRRSNKAAGMKRINLNNPGLAIEEYNNVVKIESNTFNSGISVNLKVPVNSSLTMNSTMDGDIKVSNIRGSIEAEKMVGSIFMSGISGNVVASVNSGEIKVAFDKADFSKPMSFNSFTGDIDLTFPANTSCNVKANVSRGEFYSDFDIKRAVSRPAKSVRRNGKLKIAFNDFHGTINKGGQELILKTFTGNIFLRKKK